ncbi:MAG: prepilin peptidase [Candidatus Doudnabacteria bacterium]
MTLFIVFVLGLIVGSFLNAVIFRLRSGESFLFGRSHCRTCKKELSAADLVPVFSFLMLKGKCRYCGIKLSWQYPAVELLTGGLFVLFALKFQMVFNPDFFLSLILVCFLIVIAVFDLKHYLILDKVVFAGLLVAIVRNILLHDHVILGLLAGLGVAGFFLFQYAASRGKWIGLGDVKLGLLLGNIAGWPYSILLLMLAYMSGALTGIALMLAGRKQLSSKLPFGVFLSASAIIVMLVGGPVMAWYLKLIGL